MALGVFVGDFTKQSSTGDQDIDLSGHVAQGLPDLTGMPDGSWAIVFWYASGSTPGASGAWMDDIWSSIGFVANGGGTISQYAVGTISDDGTGSSDTAHRMASACIAVPSFAATPGTAVEAQFVGFQTATTMRLNWTTVADGGIAANVNYAIITGLTGAKVVKWDTPASATTQAVTVSGVDLSNDGLVLHATAVTSTTLPASSATAYLGFGAVNTALEQWGNGFSSQDAQPDSNTARWQRTDNCIVVPNYDVSQVKLGSVTAMDNGEFTASFSTSSAAHPVASLCMSGVQSKIGSFISSGTSQTIASAHGFDPKGLLLSAKGSTPSTSPQNGAAWSLGATDGTNERAANLYDGDAQATTLAKSIWHGDKAGSFNNTGIPTTTTVDVTDLGTNDFSLSYSDTSYATGEALYLLLGSAVSAVGQNIELLWSTLATVGLSADLQWSVQALAGITLEAAWAVAGLASEDLDMPWHVRSSVGQAVQALWDVEPPPPSLSVGLQWAVRRNVPKTLDLRWHAYELVGKALGLSWDDYQTVSDTLAAAWNVRASAVDELVLRWGVIQLTDAPVRMAVSVKPAVDLRVEVS